MSCIAIVKGDSSCLQAGTRAHARICCWRVYVLLGRAHAHGAFGISRTSRWRSAQCVPRRRRRRRRVVIVSLHVPRHDTNSGNTRMTKKFRKVRKGGRSRPRVWCSWFAGRRGSRSGPTATTCRPPRGHPPRPSGAPLCTWGGAGSCTERNATHLIKHEAPARPPPPLPPHHFPVVC